MRKLIIFSIFILLIFAAFLLSFQYNLRSFAGLKPLYINDVKILVEVADTAQKQVQGLSGRSSLPENQGMLFIFDRPDHYSFWMKEMNFTLDFIWISGRQIVQINENIQPQDYQPPKTLTPNEKVDMVLEVNAGLVQKMNIKVGDKIIF
ncbi:MAG: hypothetical protein A2Y98_03465 [Candidatus Portnoybacteria bacterium RBG_19FT_COMBO_36_7]|uniref:DUF192 domain-containing protein n=1 Tax=Candidatus Portnoybacteria bacterium RBG_19FT_COMBO_36_7 TaxID=1801992 RepID=A0A1G2F7L3_9BACT|nr:MAG: hypothetical protein A2Y98_03465 [Candidatus Portnoybacteria bacterium RBG_19FT_COMBO_36_7]